MRIDGTDHRPALQQTSFYPTSEKTNTAYPTLPGRRYRSDVTLNKPDSSGWRAPSGYSVSYVDHSPSVGVITYRLTTNPKVGWHTDTHWPHAVYTPKLPASQENVLKTRALLQVKDQKINLALSLAFVKDTTDMIYRRALQMARIYDAMKAKNWTKVRRLFRQAGRPIGKRTSDNILEFQYGWRQLAMDIQGAAQELDRGLRKEHTLIYGRASQQLSVNQNRFEPGVYVWSRIGDFQYTLQEEQIHKVVMIYRTDCNWSKKMSELGLLNPLEVIADATAFSFVVNWVWPIVDWLGTIDATVGLTYLGGTYTRVSRCDGKFQVTPSPMRDYVGTGVGSGTLRWFLMDRKVIDDSVHPFYLVNPFSGSLQRALNALALLGQKAR